MLTILNNKIQSWIPILTPLSVIVGVLFYQTSQDFLFLVSWLLAFMTFSSSLGLEFKDTRSLLKYPFIVILSIIFLHIIMPVLVYFLSRFIFDDYLLTIGFVLMFAVPTGISSVMWVNLCNGNLPLCLAIILIDSLLSPIIIPGVLYISFGEIVSINVVSILLDLIWMIVIPTFTGLLINKIVNKNVQSILYKNIAPFAKLSLLAIVLINSSAIAPYLNDIKWQTISIIFLVFFISVSSYGVAFIICKLLWKDIHIIITFVFTGSMRNIALGVILATTFFSPKVAMPVIFGMLFQQILASLFSKIMFRYILKYNVSQAF